jgi:hypothetical protein
MTAPGNELQQAQRKANVKLAWVLASVAVVFFIGFVTKIVLLGR